MPLTGRVIKEEEEKKKTPADRGAAVEREGGRSRGRPRVGNGSGFARGILWDDAGHAIHALDSAIISGEALKGCLDFVSKSRPE